MRVAIAFAFLLFFGKQLFAQTNNGDNRRCQTLQVNIPFESSEIIDPASLNIADSIKSDLRIEIISARSFIVRGPDKTEKIEVCFRVLPSSLSRRFKLNAIPRYDSTALFRVPKNSTDPLFSKREELFDLGDINHGGQISRGISIGNTQDLFVNSSLNLNLEGQISEDLNIRASITDQSIPYQPEGNTQQLQDFDNVFVELYNDKFSVTGGDVVLKDESTHFLKFLKNVQGGAVKLNLNNSNSALGVSAAKGQFASITMEVKEGVLGPYKVPSPSSDSYVIIIANSEKVFIDGKQLVRGYNMDYIIDYNQAEITFTTNIVITKYSRVRVDFEYAVRDYNRSIINLSHSQEIGRLKIGANYYREADNENRPLYGELSQEDKLLLATVGNSTEQALVSSASKVAFSPDKILYVLRDTLDESLNIIKIYQHETMAMDSMYAVTFSDLGSGRGSYNIAEYLAQGRVYRWVGPGKGSYEPYSQLKAPTSREMLDVTATFKADNYSSVYIESAFSNQDQNLFSELDNEDNQGYALKTGIDVRDKPISFLGDYKFNFSTDIEYLSSRFKAIDRFRRVEFDRDWSYQAIDSLPVSDLVLSTSIGLRKDIDNEILYSFANRSKATQLDGQQHDLKLRKSLGKLQLNFNGFSSRSKMYSQNASWQKIFAETYYKGAIQPGYRFSLQQNLVVTASDSILAAANYFKSHEVFLRSNPKLDTKFEISYTLREDQMPVSGELLKSDKSENARFRFSQRFKNGHNVNFTMNYRVLRNLDTQVIADNIESITGRIYWTGDLVKNVIRNELNYSLANARVPRREYIFVEVPTGEGTHTWRDDNLDGVKDLDEFYEAIHFDERNYIKLYVNTTEFLDAYENIFNYRATLRAPKSWRGRGGILSLLSRVSNTTAWASHYRTTEDDVGARLLPFIASIDENQVLSLSESLRTTFFINKANPKFGISTGYAQFRRKQLYSNGFEARSDKEYSLIFRWNVTRAYNIKLKTLSATRVNRSDYLEGRNYDINDYKIGPVFAWQPKPTLRVTGGYNAGIKLSSSTVEDASQASLNELFAELKMGLASKYMININSKYSNISYDGNELSPLGYEMLQGFRPGDNISWSVGWQQKLINGLQINLFYEGRKPQGIDIIHSGRASVSALF